MKRRKTVETMLVGAFLWGSWSVLPGCSPLSAQRSPSDAPAIGLVRGARWSLLAIRPPYLSGPLFTLTLKDHHLTGWIAGESAPAGAVRVQIDDDSASGYAPSGPVAIDFQWTDDSEAMEGLWNGRRVHLVLTSAGLRGTVADNSDFPLLGSPTVTAERRRSLGLPPPRRFDLGTFPEMDSENRNSSCEYELDARAADGAFVGTSICAGMPQPTRLEIPAAAASWLSRPELMTVLAALLSAPPVPPSEGMAPIMNTGADVQGWP
jgi:hypothetical protein